MLDEAEIRKEIARLEYEESSYPNYAKLANLYTIRQQMQDEKQGHRDMRVSAYSGASAPMPEAVQPRTVGRYGNSDFLQEVAGKRPEEVWEIVDELMDTLAVTNRRVYDAVMRKVKNSG